MLKLIAIGIVLFLVWMALQPKREGMEAGPYDAAFFKEQSSNRRTSTWDGILQEDPTIPGNYGDFTGNDAGGVAMYAITA